MCEPITIAIGSALLSAAGTAATVSSANAAERKRANILNAAQAEVSELNKRKASKVDNFARDTYDPTKRGEVREKQIQGQESSLVDALMASGDKSIKDAEGNLSSDYLRAKATSETAAADDILKRAKLAARNAGAGLMYEQESLGGNQLSSDLAMLASQGRRATNAAGTAAGRVRDRGSLAGGLLSAGSVGLSTYKAPAAKSPKVTYI